MNHFAEVVVELFKRGDYSLITDKDGKTFKQQKEALECLADNIIEELAFGGGAGGAKSYTGWMWETLMSLAYPETHYFVARETLKDIRLYGMQSFSEVVDYLQLEIGKDYVYHAQDSYIEFYNKSKIYLLECKKKPSDKDFHGLGSSLFTSGFIEEGGEVHFDAYDTLCSRVNRWKNDDYGILGKVFITCNPTQNWLYSNFYKANRDGKLKDNQLFIPALAKDNPYVQKDYIRKLNNLKDPNKRARLYLGEWEYDDDPTKLCEYDAICDMFTNDHVKPGTKAISADLAMQGRDKFIAGSWSGMRCNVAIEKDKSSGRQIELDLKELKTRDRVGNSNIVADSDGLGAYLDSYIKNIKTFHGGSSAIDKKTYGNLKDECGFKLAEFINKREMHINCTPEQEEAIKQEISICLKRDNVDVDKKKIIKKDKMKELLGHSPDYLDMLLMKMIFHIQPQRKGQRAL
jgi:hypothetical protein